MVRWLTLLVLLAAPLAYADNVLSRRAPQLGGAPVLTDGETLVDGAFWQAPGTFTLPADGSVTWDLGQQVPLDAAAIQGDNNDDYLLEVSSDGVTFRPWWRAGPMPTPGLQTRIATTLPPASARFIRLRAEGGDGRYSVSEVEVFSGSTSGSALLAPKWLPKHPVDVAWTWLVAGAALVLFLVSRSAQSSLPTVLAAGLALGAAQVLSMTFSSPMEAARIDFLRGAVALLGAVAVARELSVRRPADPRLVLGVLGLTAAMGVLAFLNLGRPQFFDHGQGRPTFLHHYDMRTYFPIAKYFPELRFDGVYAASTVVVAEDQGGLEAMASQPLRDLRTHQVTTVAGARGHLEAVRARFSPERWAAFREDMAYFRRAMGDGGFLGSMNDHGGNATPVWFLGAWLLFAGSAASDGTLWLGVVVDIALMLLAFAALWRGWGLRTALVGMTVFGAMDFYQFGSNWFGAALRHDWLALWCLGLWALKVKRFQLAGGLLAYSALIRAFPGLALMTLAIPALWDLGARLRARTFSWASFRAGHRDVFQVAAGAAVGGGALLLVSVGLFGADAWTEWLHKVSLLDRDGHVNNLAVRTWVTGSREAWLLVVVAAVAVVVALARTAPLEVAATWAVALVPVVFNPANYYMHSAFLLVVLGRESPPGVVPLRGRLSWLILLAMCTASYFTSLTADVGSHFREDTSVLITALVALAALHLAPEAWLENLRASTAVAAAPVEAEADDGADPEADAPEEDGASAPQDAAEATGPAATPKPDVPEAVTRGEPT